MIGIGDLYLAQEDGELPTMLAVGSAPGESGVSLFGPRFRGGRHFSATAHLIWFVSPVRIECRRADRALRYEAPAGSLGICPARTDCDTDAEESVGVAVDPDRMALAAVGPLNVEDRLCDSGLAGELEDQREVAIDLRISTARSVAA